MVRKWATTAFKKILVANCKNYMGSSNIGKDKTRQALITRVVEEIIASAAQSGDQVPPNLEKVSRR